MFLMGINICWYIAELPDLIVSDTLELTVFSGKMK